jgi:serine/threonine protein kinase
MFSYSKYSNKFNFMELLKKGLKMNKKFVFSNKILFICLFFTSSLFGMKKEVNPLRVYNLLNLAGIDIQICSKQAITDKFWGRFKSTKSLLEKIDFDLIVDIVRRIDLIHKNTEQRLLKNIGIGTEKYVFKTEANEALILFKKRSNFEKNFNNEIELLHKLNHPNIVKARNVDFELFFYIQDLALCDFHEFIDKFSLKFMDQKRTIFEISREDKLLILDLLQEIAEGLNYLASQNIVHRDIKLENILIYDNEDKNFSVKLSDLSFAIKIPESEAFIKQRSLKGTTFYLNPKSIYFIRKTKIKFGS